MSEQANQAREAARKEAKGFWKKLPRWVRIGIVAVVVVNAVALVGGVGLGAYAIIAGGKEAPVTVESGTWDIGGMYSTTVELDQVQALELRDGLPAITLRTNGYAAGGTLKGWFSTSDLGKVKLFVHGSVSPYIYAQTPEYWLIFGYEDPERTEALFQELQASWSPTAS